MGFNSVFYKIILYLSSNINIYKKNVFSETRSQWYTGKNCKFWKISRHSGPERYVSETRTTNVESPAEHEIFPRSKFRRAENLESPKQMEILAGDATWHLRFRFRHQLTDTSHEVVPTVIWYLLVGRPQRTNLSSTSRYDNFIATENNGKHPYFVLFSNRSMKRKKTQLY